MALSNQPANEPPIYAVILCGGSGSRLWPRSRSRHPKHLLQLNGGQTLVQETIQRLDLPREQVFCITEASHSELLRGQVPDIPPENILVEPDRRGSASAVALAVATLARRAPRDAVVLSLHADALIRQQDQFVRSVAAWVDAIKRTDTIINLGIRPTYPSTAFGYINFGEKLTEAKGFDVFKTERFVEKPNESTARMYMDSGRYLWNSGLFGGKLSVLEAEMRLHMADWMDTLDTAFAEAEAGDQQAIDRQYLALQEDAIDVTLLEKSSRLAVIPASFDWADVGSWADLHDVLERDTDCNIFEGDYVDLGSRNCFIHSPDQLVATIGLENLVIINTKDAVLICPRDRSQDVKKIVKKLKDSDRANYL